MPLKGEAKLEYNRLYYERNKIKLNAEKVVRLVKNGKQKRVKPPTIVKYEQGFDGNQLEFVNRLATNSTLERKHLYELPPPPPILEVPEQPEDIPFVPRLPEREVFKENQDPDTFTIDEAKRVIHINRREDNGGTEKSYKGKIVPMMRVLGIDNDQEFSKIFKKNTFEQIVEKLANHYKRPSGYYQLILYITERSEKLQRIIPNGEEFLNKLRRAFRDASDREKTIARDERKEDKTNYIQHYKDLFAIEDKWAKKDYASHKHLIALLYSKALYDDNGELLLIPRNYFWNVELVERDSDMKKKERTKAKTGNYYNVQTGRLWLQSFKTDGKYDDIDLKLNKYTQKAIKKSYENNKRQYLFQTKFGNRYADENSFGGAIVGTIGIGIDIFRRAFINYEYHINKRPRDEIAKKAQHGTDVNELVYSTTESNESLQNTIYDETVIGRKVNVVITRRGKNRGKTLVGVVYRSLEPNRDEFPYEIVFDPKYDEPNEYSDEIPDPEDGITMYNQPKKPKGRPRRR